MIKGSYNGPSVLGMVAFFFFILLVNLAIYAVLFVGALLAVRWVFFS